MIHRAGPPPPPRSELPPAPTNSHRRRNLVVALVTTLAIGAVTALAAVAYRASEGDLVGTTTVTASSSAVGTSPGDVVPHPGARGGGWRSNGETVGAWVELAWPASQQVRRVSITRDGLDRPGATDGFLSFGDGSFEQVRLDVVTHDGSPVGGPIGEPPAVHRLGGQPGSPQCVFHRHRRRHQRRLR